MRTPTGRMNNTLRIRVSDEELSLIQELAKGYKNLSEYLRLKALCNQPDCPVKNPEDRTKRALEILEKQLKTRNIKV